MAMRQLGRNIPVFFRTAAVGSAARQLHPPVTRPLSYGFGCSFPSGGAAFGTSRFFCTELPPPPQRRRTQGLINFMRAFTTTFIRESIVVAAGLTLVVVSCNALGFDVRRKLHKMLVVKSKKD